MVKVTEDFGVDTFNAYMLRTGGVYAIVNEDDDVLYVGQTQHLLIRWAQHCQKDSTEDGGVPVNEIYQFVVLEYSDDKYDRLVSEELYTSELLPRYGSRRRVRKRRSRNQLTWDEPVLKEDHYNALTDDEKIAVKLLDAKTKRERTEPIMQELYNAKRIDAHRVKITKFDRDLNPKRDHTGRTSSYVVSDQGCDCPQGHAKSCRHRKMLPFFILHGYVDTEYFFVWDTHQWYKPTGIFREARKANGLPEPKVTEDPLLSEQLPGALFRFDEPTKEVVEAASKMLTQDNPFNPFNKPTEGGPKPASAAPSPQPSRTFRRF